MMSSRLRSVHEDQRGLTLVELMIAIVLAGIVTAGITMTFAHLLAGSTRTSNHMTAVRQVQSAGYWVSKDTLQAQPPLPQGEGSGFPFTLTWTGPDETVNEIVYTIEDNNLQRSLSITPAGEDPTIKVSVVAQYIDPAETSFLRSNGAFVFTVTATVGGQSETRIYEIMPRPGS